MIIVADIEADNLLEDVTKIHCFCYHDLETNTAHSLTKYEDILKLLDTPNLTIIGHNFIRYDDLVIRKVLGIKTKYKIIDTLSLAWYLDADKKKHSLEVYGESFGVKKPAITDWNNLTVEEYVHRCEEDVKINLILWRKQESFLKYLYREKVYYDKFIEYLMFKTYCIRDQEIYGIGLNVKYCTETLEKLSIIKQEKILQLIEAMPKNPILKPRKVKNVLVDAENKFVCYADDILPGFEGDLVLVKSFPMKVLTGYEPGNPSSVPQLKNWLFSLGWKPEHYKHNRDKKTNTIKKVEQIAHKDIKGEVCDSVKKLFEIEPKLELLNGLSIISHRISILKGFLKDQKNGRLKASAHGFTNTLRLMHKEIVNLPGVDKLYGEEIRGCIIADKDCSFLGCDLTNIEDKTKRHYIFKYDPDYVNTMNIPGYDAHLEIAMLGGYLEQKDIDFYKETDKYLENCQINGETVLLSEEDKARYKSIKKIRQKAKVTNFSCTYKVGAPTLSRNMGAPEKEAKSFIDVFWKRNKAILQIEKDTVVRKINGDMWLQNPMNMFWYSLRNEKDIFSTLNQGKHTSPLIQKCIMKNSSNSVKLPCGQYRAKLRKKFLGRCND